MPRTRLARNWPGRDRSGTPLRSVSPSRPEAFAYGGASGLSYQRPSENLLSTNLSKLDRAALLLAGVVLLRVSET